MEIKYFKIFALCFVIAAAILFVPSECVPWTSEIGKEANPLESVRLNAAPLNKVRNGRYFLGGYPMGLGGFGGSSASASASASASSGGMGYGGYPLMYGK